MRIALTADIHFDEYVGLSTPSEFAVTSRLSDIVVAFNWMVREALNRKCTALAVLGDVFENRTAIDLTVLHAACDAVRRAVKSFDYVWMIPGNHDCHLRVAAIHSLSVFTGGASVIATATVVQDMLAFIPWGDNPEALARGIDTVLSRTRGKQAKPVLFSHVLLNTVAPAGVDPSILRADRFRRVFLGDVHEHMSVGRNIMYVGALMPLDFRDAGDCKRGFVVYDTDTDKTEFVPNTVSPRFHVLTDEPSAAVVSSLSKQDYVRVETDDPELASRVAERVRRVTSWVESPSVPPADAAPRIAFASSSQRDILAGYVAHRSQASADEQEALVDLGMQLLQEGGGRVED